MDIKKTFGKKLKDSKKLLSGIYKNLNKINDSQKKLELIYKILEFVVNN